MADISKLKAEIRKRTGLSERQVNRLIAQREQKSLLSRQVATMAVAVDRNVPIGKYASEEDLAQLRSATNTVPQATPPAPEATPTPRPRKRAPSSPTNASRRRRSASSRSKVFVAHGRNDRLRKDMFSFLRSIGLEPLEWQKGIKATQKGSPSIPDILDAMFQEAAAVVVLLTPDDTARLKPEFRKPSDSPDETKYVGQARPNVLFEAGMAFGSHPDSVVLAQVGQVKPFTNVSGLHVTHLNNTPEARQELAAKLKAAGCDVDTDGSDWYSTGHFELKDKDDK